MPVPGPDLLLAAAPAALALALLHGHEQRRRRRSLEEALHELRRPLQLLALVARRGEAERDSVRAALEQAAHALARLESLVTGQPPVTSERPAGALGDLIESAAQRWSVVPGIRFEGDRLDRRLATEPLQAGAAVDNLIANAVEHGSGDVIVRVDAEGDRARIEVSSRGEPGARPTASRRRGHGLAIVERIAREQGGELAELRSEGERTVARLHLPIRDAGR